MRINPSKFSYVIELMNYVVCIRVWCKSRSFITDDYDNNKESAITSSSPSITSYSESPSLAVVFVNDELNDSENMTVEEEKEGDNGEWHSLVYFVQDNS